ncbi:hypothetical protein LF41_2032 [Lysobacter dokdonensis DS-58]|uniref:Uncharacterized protein n=1 Tax=Lysobacter dokdonensis DS-58 TaxID=1300345 RepID=A0A0A2WHT2_9GAMM|nr:hypothetical protein LF41_2032 [Lysobacter dokdonensis DS-58]
MSPRMSRHLHPAASRGRIRFRWTVEGLRSWAQIGCCDAPSRKLFSTARKARIAPSGMDRIGCRRDMRARRKHTACFSSSA